jgi:hypothetical protein
MKSIKILLLVSILFNLTSPVFAHSRYNHYRPYHYNHYGYRHYNDGAAFAAGAGLGMLILGVCVLATQKNQPVPQPQVEQKPEPGSTMEYIQTHPVSNYYK